jgi:demethylmenaquinone methyltransferase/2-methoxy-6-polyprenyl-1,4-benzoquinol methylase
MFPVDNEYTREKIVKKFIYELNRPENRRKKAKYVRDIFDSVSPAYDRMNTIMSLGMHGYWRKNSIKLLEISSGERVLDVCCGTADFAIDISRKVGPKGRVVATDFSEGMLSIGIDKIRADPLCNGNISPGRADTMHLPFKSESFDVVTVAYGMRNLANLETGLAEIFRVLRKGGRYGCLDLATPTMPGYSNLYHFYFFRMVPYVGKLVSGSKDPYAYLPNSLRTFIKPDDLKALMEKVGFCKVRYKKYAAGAVALHIGEKPKH